MQYRVFHGTLFEFESFEDSFQCDDLGFFFSECADDARSYGDRVMECRITITNPYVVKSSEIFVGINEIDENTSPWCIGRKALKSQGFDGVIVIGSEDEKEKTGEYESLYTQYIVFVSKQIEVIRCS